MSDRWELLANWFSPVSKSLKYRLKAGDAAGFDQMLLDYMAARTGPRYFFDPKEVPQYVSFLQGDTASRSELSTSAQAQVGAADDILAHRFPEQVNSGGYTVQLPSGAIDWDAQPAGVDAPDVLHTLNGHSFWEDLSVAYRMTGDRRYARELGAQLSSWYAQNPPLKNPDDWSKTSPRWWLLDTARRVDHWVRSYFLLLGTAGLTPEANTLFLSGLLRHGDFLSRVTPRSTASNWTVYHGAALAQIGTLFPEFAQSAVWTGDGNDLLLSSIDRQFFADGGHVEQSPSYASTVLQVALQQCWLSRLNDGALWTRRTRLRMASAVEALYQLTEPDGKLPPLSDTYRYTSPRAFFNQAAEILDQPRYRLTVPGLEDLWLFGTAAVAPHLNDSAAAALTDRGGGYALRSSGYYIARPTPVATTGPDGATHQRDQAQLIFDAGPTGGTHGHYDLLSFDLSAGYGELVADPGPAQYGTSAERRRVVSTPAHNTISIDGLNHAAIEGAGNPDVVVDKWEVTDDQAVITAHHHAYEGFKGSPVVGRSIWFDRTGTDFSAMLVVDWGVASATHTFTTSMNLRVPLSYKVRNGIVHVWTEGGGMMRVQPVLSDRQSLAVDPTVTYPYPPPGGQEAAIRYAVSQTARSALFVTLIARESEDLTGLTASLAEPPRRGRALKVRLHMDGQPDRIIAFDPPDLTRLSEQAPSTSPGVLTKQVPAGSSAIPQPNLRQGLFGVVPVQVPQHKLDPSSDREDEWSLT